MTTPPTTHRFWDRAALRRHALLNELTLACGSGEVPLDYKHDDDGSDQSASSLKPVLPVPADDDVAYRFIAPEVLHEMATPRYTAFWRNIKHLETAHRDICLAAFKATLDATMADERPEEIYGLEELLSSAGTLLTQWKLVNETGQGPLTGPFIAALIQGVRQRAPRPGLLA